MVHKMFLLFVFAILLQRAAIFQNGALGTVHNSVYRSAANWRPSRVKLKHTFFKNIQLSRELV